MQRASCWKMLSSEHSDRHVQRMGRYRRADGKPTFRQGHPPKLSLALFRDDVLLDRFYGGYTILIGVPGSHQLEGR